MSTVYERSVNISSFGGYNYLTKLSRNLHLSRPPPWLGVVWDSGNANGSGSSGKLAGSAIYLGDGHMITHNLTSGALLNSAMSVNGEYTKFQPAQLSALLPATLDTKVGPRNTSHWYKEDSTVPVGTQLGCAPFDLHKITPFPRSSPEQSLVKSSLKNIQRPTFEQDIFELGTDCHAYTWSRGLEGLSPSPYSGRKDDYWIRHFVRFPVDREKCQGARCEFTINEGNICDGPSDLGSPILCGPQKKLTYLINPDQSAGCGGFFEAYHVARMVQSIKSLNLGHIL